MKLLSSTRVFSKLGYAAAFCWLLNPLARAVVADGLLDPNEGYTNTQGLIFFDQQKGTAHQGSISWHVEANGDVYAAFTMPVSLNDNTYGANSIGWDGDGGKKKTEHTLQKLLGSDHAVFQFTNNAGVKVLDFKLDYITATNTSPSGFDSLGVLGGDGKMNVGNAANVLQWGTSLDYTFNQLGYSRYQVDSPLAHPQLNPDGTIDYSKPYILDDLTAAGWIFPIIYEVKVAGAAFGPSGFGGVRIPEAHNSPSKTGTNTVPVIPEPSTLSIAGGFFLLIGAFEWARSRRRARAATES